MMWDYRFMFGSRGGGSLGDPYWKTMSFLHSGVVAGRISLERARDIVRVRGGRSKRRPYVGIRLDIPHDGMAGTVGVLAGPSSDAGGE